MTGVSVLSFWKSVYAFLHKVSRHHWTTTSGNYSIWWTSSIRMNGGILSNSKKTTKSWLRISWKSFTTGCAPTFFGALRVKFCNCPLKFVIVIERGSMSDARFQNEVIVPVSLTPLQKEVYKSVLGVWIFCVHHPLALIADLSHREEYRDLEDVNLQWRTDLFEKAKDK